AGVKPPKGVKVVDAYLYAQRERAIASRELAKLNTHLPLTLDLEAVRCKPPQAAMLAPLLRRLDFNKFLEDINQDDLASYEAEATAAAKKASPQEHIDPTYHIIDTQEKFDAFCKEWKKQPAFAIDTETTSTNPRAADLLGISICWKAHEAHYLAVHGPLAAEKLDVDKTLACMKDVLEDPKIEKIGHHIKYDIQVFRRYGIVMRGVAFDTLIGGWLLDPGALRLNLEELAYTHLQRRLGDKTKGKEQLDLISVEDAGCNACQGVDCIWQLTQKFKPMLKEAGLEPLLRDIEVPLIQVLADMESTGIRVDGDLLRKMSANLEQQLAAQETDIYELAGEKFNINSTRQLGDILFEKLGLESKAKTSTGKNSTSEEVLTQLAKEHELPRRILDFRGMQKLKSTYLDALPQMISTRTGRIHCTFHQTGAETGRISSNDPNLQNIPIRSELGRSIRAAFKPGVDDWRILAADYSQIELRILAHYSEDKALIQAFEEGTDIHTAVAARLFSVKPKDVSREQRARAKAVNFGIIYGQTAFGLSGVLTISRSEAQTIIDTYFSNHPGVRQCIDNIIKKARESGYVTTVMGRRRFVNEINASDRANRALGERLAVNTVFQGSAADLIKKAMIDIHRELKPSSAPHAASEKKPKNGARKDWQSNMILQIHDELLFESPPDEAQKLADLVKSKMEGALELRVPLVVDVGIGDDWLSAKD
ncbi:MAG TPA: DNA polymerase I, partial [Planctomycetota bacterium]|nr:DNA polymerase I [Planctomycetota bacterium]